MKNTFFKFILILLIATILFVSVPIHQARAGDPITMWIIGGLILGALGTYDYLSCDINILWGGCGSGGGGTPPSPTASLSANPTTITKGQSSTGFPSTL